MAEYGNEIFPLAEEKNVMVQFEAAVAGGIPIIKALREGLAANQIRSIAGIINGTSNFILTEMREKGSAFADVLKEAQALGYAEADPTFDIEVMMLAINYHYERIGIRYADELFCLLFGRHQQTRQP